MSDTIKTAPDHETLTKLPLAYQRRKTRVVYVGDVAVGGDNPIRVQSMTIADTMDTQATVDEIEQLAGAGCEIVRLTAPSMREAENLRNIKAELKRRRVRAPLVADIHFTPNAALIAADYVEKVRINPGNYADKKKFEQREYSDAEYLAELKRIEEKFKPLVLKCKALGRAMRIGTNHGSLSDRIMNRYGDTAEGMVESALEFVRICEKYDYHDIILSMKSSNPQVAIQAYRLLAARMNELHMDYPFHLGVTEAGDGEEARIKSAVGIGALLEDGIGDTIRVSLTEDSIAEIPVAFAIAHKFNRAAVTFPKGSSWSADLNGHVRLPSPFAYQRRQTLSCDAVYHKLGSEHIPRVELSASSLLKAVDGSSGNGFRSGRTQDKLRLVDSFAGIDMQCETVHLLLKQGEGVPEVDRVAAKMRTLGMAVPLCVDITRALRDLTPLAAMADRLAFSVHRRETPEKLQRVLRAAQRHGKPVQWNFVLRNGEAFGTLDDRLLSVLNASKERDYWNVLFSLSCPRNTLIYTYRYLAGRLDAIGANLPILLTYRSSGDFDSLLLDASAQLGSLLCDGIGDAIHFDVDLPSQDLLRLSYNLLQASRLRISKTEFISCPSCGRTLFNLQTTTERIKAKTAHLKGVKIAIMGCIVNGPGEMADADFGYVGAGPQKINLFVGKECVKRNIPEDRADQELIDLIKQHGRWLEP